MMTTAGVELAEPGGDTLDAFAGGGGWSVAARLRGLLADGIEIMPQALATRRAAGLRTVATDVTRFTTYPGQYRRHLGSPPCQSFSIGGNGAGRKALDAVLYGVSLYARGIKPSYAELVALTGDERTALVLEVLRLALEGMPEAIAWEQVPAVLPVWDACGEVLEARGYSVAVGIVYAEQYGVPQVRKRAVLVARRDGYAAELPAPTHSRYYPQDPARLDPGLLPWVPMAAVLGWGMTHRPSMTVTGGGTDTGGAEPFGTQARAGMLREFDAGRWIPRPGGDPGGSANFRPTAAEMAALQTFPLTHPFQGTEGRVKLQIGNAVPPGMAGAVIDAMMRVPVLSAGCDQAIARHRVQTVGVPTLFAS